MGLSIHQQSPRSCIFFLLICFLGIPAFSQVKVSMKLLNKKDDPVPYASFTVISRADSLKRMSAVADSTGLAQFDLQLDQQYIVRISAVNFNDIEKGIRITSERTAFVFAGEQVSKTLEGVTVTSSKPLMRQEDDKTIVDPENLATVSTNAYEVIEKTPGLFVDQDGNVYISSNTPATIYINGREMKMSASDVATMLKSLPPNAISRIEVLRTPSAKYDASGSGGVVNIVLKKGVKLGLTGSVNTGLQQGRYGNQYIGFTLNNNDDKKNSYLNLNYGRRSSYESLETNRLFATDSTLQQSAYTKYPGHSYYIGYGLGRQLTEKWEVNYDMRTSVNFFRNHTTNNSRISKISTNELVTNNITRVTNDGNSLTTNHGVAGKYKIDTLGSELTIDASYTFSRNKNEQDFDTKYIMPAISSTSGNGDVHSERNLVAIQTDIRKKYPKQFTAEAGLKSSFLYYNNASDYVKANGATTVKDEFRTNTYKYRENINSAYLQGSKTIGTVVIKVGARIENTRMKGQQIIPFDTSFNIERTDIFPYVYLSKKVMSIAGYDLRAYLVHRRTISRPGYELLNPFPRYIDQYLFETGNPSLRPQFTRNYEANVSVDERPIIAIGYNYTKDIFTQVMYQADSLQSLAYRTYDNLGTNKEMYFRAMGAIPPGGTYFFVVVAQYNRNFYEGSYENKPLSFKKGSWTFYTYHTLKLGKLSNFVVNGFMRLKGQQQFYELGSFGSLNASINRQFFKQKLTVTLSANDIFYTNKNDFTLSQGSVNAFGNRKSDTQRFGLNFRYNFGIRKKEEGNDMFNVEGVN